MRALSSLSAVAALIPVAGLLAAAHEHPSVRRWADARAENERLTEYGQYCRDQAALNRHLIDDLIAGRVELAPAVEVFTRANTDRSGILEAVAAYHPAPTREEGVARYLLWRAGCVLESNPSARDAVLDRLADEYAARFGRRPPGPSAPGSVP